MEGSHSVWHRKCPGMVRMAVRPAASLPAPPAPSPPPTMLPGQTTTAPAPRRPIPGGGGLSVHSAATGEAPAPRGQRGGGMFLAAMRQPARDDARAACRARGRGRVEPCGWHRSEPASYPAKAPPRREHGPSHGLGRGPAVCSIPRGTIPSHPRKSPCASPSSGPVPAGWPAATHRVMWGHGKARRSARHSLLPGTAGRPRAPARNPNTPTPRYPDTCLELFGQEEGPPTRAPRMWLQNWGEWHV